MILPPLRDGIERMPVGRRRQILDAWLREALPLRFDQRVLSIDGAVADAWGGVMARRAAAGQPIGIMDAFIAATTEVHALTLVTRNAADFQTSVKAVVNPSIRYGRLSSPCKHLTLWSATTGSLRSAEPANDQSYQPAFSE